MISVSIGPCCGSPKFIIKSGTAALGYLIFHAVAKFEAAFAGPQTLVLRITV
jgi:hypothetical protein